MSKRLYHKTFRRTNVGTTPSGHQVVVDEHGSVLLPDAEAAQLSHAAVWSDEPHEGQQKVDDPAEASDSSKVTKEEKKAIVEMLKPKKKIKVQAAPVKVPESTVTKVKPSKVSKLTKTFAKKLAARRSAPKVDDSMSKEELRKVAKKLGVDTTTRMPKVELLRLINKSR